MDNPNIYLSLNTFLEKLLQWLFIKSHQNERKQASLNVAFQWVVAFQKDILNCKWDFEGFFFFFFPKRDYNNWKQEKSFFGSVLYILLNENWFGKEMPLLWFHSIYYLKDCAFPRGSN